MSSSEKTLLPAETLDVYGVRENNLKNISLKVQHDKLTVITGLSGSGKSTLAFDTLYAEGGRRYIETFSPYTRQFLDRLHKPDIDAIDGVRPALALEQRNRITSSRSTVGTVSEVNDYLKIIWAYLGTLHCPSCNNVVIRQHPQHILTQLEEQEFLKNATLLLICFSIKLHADIQIASLIPTLQSQGFLRYFSRSANTVQPLEQLLSEDKPDDILVIVDRLKISNASELSEPKVRERLLQSLADAYTAGHGTLYIVASGENNPPRLEVFSSKLRCVPCNRDFSEPKPSLFSFNNPIGACKTCNGFGKVLELDPDLCIPDPGKTIGAGAIQCWSTAASANEFGKLKTFCKEQDIPLNAPWSSLSESQKKLIFEGPPKAQGKGAYRGLRAWFKKLQGKRHKMHVRVFLARYRSEQLCSACQGSRLIPDALWYSVQGLTLPDVWQLPLEDALRVFTNMLGEHQTFGPLQVVFEEIVSRLQYLVQIGLAYLTLDRQSRTLSGGESQRVNLTSILGSRLVKTTLVLDEPTIGLHSSDSSRLLDSLRLLRDRGNTVIVVEHDPEIIRNADEVIDIGPDAGSHGGEIVYQGSVEGLAAHQNSYTARYLRGESFLPAVTRENEKQAKTLEVTGASAHNLSNVNVSIPLQRFVVITGVSGSGKSTLVHKCIFEPISRLKQNYALSLLTKGENAVISGIAGQEAIDEIVLIDQQPIGKTPRSNPATYTKAWDLIRECLEETPAATRLGLGKSAFSFNVDGGRCIACSGAGQIRIEMQFLADVFVECETCGGSRFQDQVLGVTLGGKNVLELLRMSLSDAVELFAELGDEKRSRGICNALQPLIDLGLGYLSLGHPLSKVSGGEAQRIKLASYLSSSSKSKCLFVLDEPTTGLHPYNISHLYLAFRKLIEKGHSVLCIEHNLDLIAQADWLIDLGPGGGVHGGEIVAAGPVQTLLSSQKHLRSSKTLSALAEYIAERVSAKKSAAVPQKVSQKSPTYTTQPNRPIAIHGARENNLKNISLEIPQNKLCAITGVSGSGKSTLAFDILFAEGQRRYIDCLSPYARQYIKQLSRADVDRIDAIPPTIAVSQKTAPPLGVSTIATTTELYQYLRLLYSKTGTQLCVDDQTPVSSLSTENIAQEIAKRFKGKRILLFAPAVTGRKGYYNDLFQRALRAEIFEAKIDGKIVKLEEDLRLDRHKLHWISLAVASLKSPKATDELLIEAIKQCLLLGNGVVEVYVDTPHGKPVLFSTERVCASCQRGYRELDPQDFSFRSARGVCEACNGRGKVPVDLNGRNTRVCPSCKGARLSEIGRNVVIQGKHIFELTKFTAPELLVWISQLELGDRMKPVVEPILRELQARLEIITSVGLDYLQLDRDASSISGGEAQRLRLAKTLGSPLTGVCYVLDEPSIGLHPQDHAQLMQTLYALRDNGNTVIVVEHDEETIRSADHIIDIGPRGGEQGGNLVAQGNLSTIMNTAHSLTGQALRERSGSSESKLEEPKRELTDWIEVSGANANTLKQVSVRFPLRALSVVAGVSGAGKSSLVHGTLVPAIVEEFEGESERKKYYDKTWDKVKGLEQAERFIEIDQSPVGKTPTSTPASFLGVFNDIRELYASIPEAAARGYTASFFSFNTGKGRCSACEGRGYVKVPMSFLPDALTPCETCSTLRYGESALEILYQGLSIGELLKKTFTQARDILKNHKRIVRSMDYVISLGLGYLTLGQPTHTLSGGEAQRLKIARELGLREAKNTIYILDEPTIGLHMVDVDKLTSVLQTLVKAGNTVLVIEHNLDIIRAADYLVEMGPGPGSAGGQVLFQGTLKEFSKLKTQTPTRNELFKHLVISKEKIKSKPKKSMLPISIKNQAQSNTEVR